MQINIEDYIDPDTIREVIVGEIKDQTRAAFRQRALAPDTLLANAGYYAVFQAVDEFLGTDGYAQETVKNETLRVLRDMDSYALFSDRGRYPHYRPSAAQNLVDEAVEQNRGTIESQVRERLSDISGRIGGTRINEFIADVVRTALDDVVDP